MVYYKIINKIAAERLNIEMIEDDGKDLLCVDARFVPQHIKSLEGYLDYLERRKIIAKAYD